MKESKLEGIAKYILTHYCALTLFTLGGVLILCPAGAIFRIGYVGITSMITEGKFVCEDIKAWLSTVLQSYKDIYNDKN